MTASFNPNTTASTSTLTGSSTAIAGTATVTITGTSGSLRNTTTVSPTVRAVTVSTLPSAWTDGDIGSTGVAGNPSYSSGVFTVKGAGGQIYGTADGFHSVHQPLTGDGTIVARVVRVQGAGSSYAGAGVMIRETLDGGSTNANTSDWVAYGGIYFDVRAAVAAPARRHLW